MFPPLALSLVPLLIRVVGKPLAKAVGKRILKAGLAKNLGGKKKITRQPYPSAVRAGEALRRFTDRWYITRPAPPAPILPPKQAAIVRSFARNLRGRKLTPPQQSFVRRLATSARRIAAAANLTRPNVGTTAKPAPAQPTATVKPAAPAQVTRKPQTAPAATPQTQATAPAPAPSPAPTAPQQTPPAPAPTPTAPQQPQPAAAPAPVPPAQPAPGPVPAPAGNPPAPAPVSPAPATVTPAAAPPSTMRPFVPRPISAAAMLRTFAYRLPSHASGRVNYPAIRQVLVGASRIAHQWQAKPGPRFGPKPTQQPPQQAAPQAPPTGPTQQMLFGQRSSPNNPHMQGPPPPQPQPQAAGGGNAAQPPGPPQTPAAPAPPPAPGPRPRQSTFTTLSQAARRLGGRNVARRFVQGARIARNLGRSRGAATAGRMVAGAVGIATGPVGQIALLAGGAVLLSKAFTGLTKRAEEHTRALVDSRRELTRYSGQLAAQFTRLEAQSLRLTREQARATAGSSSKLVEEYREMRDALAPLGRDLASVANLVGAGVANVGELAGNAYKLVRLVTGIGAVIDTIEKLLGKDQDSSATEAQQLLKTFRSDAYAAGGRREPLPPLK